MVSFDQELWDRIEEFDIDGGPRALTFRARLARENQWSLDFAERVIDEYKRFVYLSQRAGHPVTPSNEVDQAWHLHLTYTRSYWERLCAEVLDRPLHHEPTQGGEAEGEKFDDWYRKTQESYEHHFGAPPPADIWPPSEVRFDPEAMPVSVNRSDYWLVPREWIRRLRMTAVVALASLTLYGCIVLTDEDGRAEVDVGALVFTLLAFGIVIFLVLRFGGRGGGGKGGGSGCGGAYWGGCTGGDGGGDGGGGSGCGGGGCGGGCGG